MQILSVSARFKETNFLQRKKDSIMKLKTLAASLILFLVGFQSVFALEADDQRKFEKYMKMGLPELTDVAAKKLKEKYPAENWKEWHFPRYAKADKTIKTSYRIAVKEPELLGTANISDKQHVIPCYCTCQNFGHDNLLYCFLKDGVIGGKFDDHGSQCGICMRQAFLAFLWADLGASHAEIILGMEQKFAPLIKAHKKGK